MWFSVVEKGCPGRACKLLSLPQPSRGASPTEHSASNPYQSISHTLLTFPPVFKTQVHLRQALYHSCLADRHPSPQSQVYWKMIFYVSTWVFMSCSYSARLAGNWWRSFLELSFPFLGVKPKLCGLMQDPHFGSPQSTLHTGLCGDGYCLSP